MAFLNLFNLYHSIFDFIHLISEYTNVLVVENSTALI